MWHRLRHLSFAISVALVVGPARAVMAAWPHDPLVNLPVCAVPGQQSAPVVTADGAGGVILAWMDRRDGGQYDIFAQHVTASGAVDPGWPAGGLAVASGPYNDWFPRIAPDGSGGAIISWATDAYRAYVQHVLAAGVIDPAWPAGGREVTGGATVKWEPDLVSDGAGGAIVAWRDYRSGTGNEDIYAQHVLASGALDPAWPATGTVLSAAPGTQEFPRIVADGSGGAFVAWQDRNVASDINLFAHHVLASGAADPRWPANGLALCVAPGDQYDFDLVADGSGGAIAAWDDFRGGVSRVYAQRFIASGTVVWTPNGRSMYDGSWPQQRPQVAPDGIGGAIISWTEFSNGDDVFAQHVLPSGGTDARWPANGLNVSAVTGNQVQARITPDGSGGAFLAWQDDRTAPYDVYAHHVLGSGAKDPDWPASGMAVCSDGRSQELPILVADGLGGAVVAWLDARFENNKDVFAQRVAPFGYLGTPEPEIAGVRDVPFDEGGRVKVSWSASYLDTERDPNLALYELYRSVPPNVAAAMLARGQRSLGSLAAGAGREPGALFTTNVGTTAYYWEFVESRTAVHYLPGYSTVTATTSDSTADGNPTTAFMIVARNEAGTVYWLSRPASGYSVDDLPPLTPAALTSSYADGDTRLHWEPNAEADLASYRVYRGTSATFVPGPDNLVSSPPDTGWADAAQTGWHYKVSAVDVHGNESGFALLSPVPTTDAPGAGAAGHVSLSRPSPQPARSATTLRYSLARSGLVRLEVYDVTGRRVRVLAEGVRAPGEHVATWDLRDDAGRAVGAGFYLARLEAEGKVLTERVMALR